ncbi:nitronate monooxygenase [Gordonia sp. TBRC 11910]|uniref:Nitronate monooxygenase n=1 Tax=Gordonia asplenii TaxID=2725283 RepID=A0A848KY65_9ACTN|nr:nitronate monooxygenase family protein [Gordonia asplenii]NMO03610.1 nitronate monooxygenase [Gordonia asplenii]
MSLPESVRDRLRLPVLASPMFIVSGPELVVAQCTAGVIGSFPTLNARPHAQLEEWLDRITRELADYDARHPDRPSAPYAVNLIVHSSNQRLDKDLATVVKYRVPVVITSLGARTDVNDAIHSYGGIVLHDVIDEQFARKAVEKGADGLIAVAAGAGGHAGTRSPFAFIEEIRSFFDGPLVLSGSIATGRSVLAAQAMGADLAYIGSAFIATEEADAVPSYKEMIVDSSARDIVYADCFTGIHANYLRGSIVGAGLDPAALTPAGQTPIDFAINESDAVAPARQVKPWRDIWGAGQGIGAVSQIVPAAALVDRLESEYLAALNTLASHAPSPAVGS